VSGLSLGNIEKKFPIISRVFATKGEKWILTSSSIKIVFPLQSILTVILLMSIIRTWKNTLLRITDYS